MEVERAGGRKWKGCIIGAGAGEAEVLGAGHGAVESICQGVCEKKADRAAAAGYSESIHDKSRQFHGSIDIPTNCVNF